MDPAIAALAVPPPVSPMLAKAGPLPRDPNLQYDPKWDGFRCIVYRAGDAVELGHALLEDLRGDSVHPIVYDRGLFWRYDAARGVFAATNRDEAYNAISRYAGCWTGTSKPRPLALNDNGIKGAVNAAARFAASPGFFPASESGVDPRSTQRPLNPAPRPAFTPRRVSSSTRTATGTSR